MKRTFTCGELTQKALNKKVVLNGWVFKNRDHGGIQFINLRDRYGVTQIVIDKDSSAQLHELAKGLKFEYCIAVEGTVRLRPADMINREMTTGEIEVQAEKIEVLSECAILPFMVEDETDARDDLRLKYRYLDLRSLKMQKNIILRHEAAFRVREYLRERGFLEIETPTLIKSTPEGARDFVVPSRVHPGKFFALPQSPQLFKQLLMVAGFDKYFQIARCYRDEDPRGDRQLEFTQIDLEMSFVSKDDVFEVTEGMMAHVFDKCLGYELNTPFPRIAYQEAMDRYGSDKPDLRFALELQDFSQFVEPGAFTLFKELLTTKGGTIKALVAPGCGDYSRKRIGELEETAKVYGAKGLAWMKVTEAGLDGGISKFYAPQKDAICGELGAKAGDLILMVGSDWKTACLSLGAVRLKLGEQLNLISDQEFKFCWIIDFPLFEWDEENQKWEASHHMFTMPQQKYLDSFDTDPEPVLGDLYDLVCNGNELASGSIRVHDPKIQKRIFNVVGFSEEEAKRRFGFLLNAFNYGPPPHGGIAPGFDRLIMIMSGDKNIREVIPFPKNSFGVSPMDDTPAEINQEQLRELHIKVDLPKD